ncbi:P-type conjugative transfer protein TrbJ [Acidithiobacillus ferrooxidans]|uniref:P-type conjugative transfer protein TrbJ n=1 Tax=Acidithiobacillus ferrooxidans TaxID=920 RepID=UPI00214C8972|nr:P-type conjugative transfer protein TrbJ [Acidithiobacillus ferrooxidans]MCR2830538.1 P-type conjugative transfer protein TrbJ [Acidithiobacillus ferrooxidans]
MNKPCNIILISAIAFALTPASALAGTLTGGATMPEQIVQEITAVQQLAQQAQQVQEQIQMVYQQAMNLKNLPTQMWSSVSGDLNNLVNIAGQAQGLSYASQNIASQFSQTYPAASSIGNNYGQQMRTWTTDTNGQIQSMLQQNNLQASQFASQQSALQAIQNASQSASGRMQVLQAGNQIAGMEVNQIQQLQQEIMAGNSAIGSYEAQQVNQQQQATNSENSYIQQNNAVTDTNMMAITPITIPGGGATATAP